MVIVERLQCFRSWLDCEALFRSKLAQAVNTLAARRPETCKQARERAERERNRYRGLKRRPRTKGE